MLNKVGVIKKYYAASHKSAKVYHTRYFCPALDGHYARNDYLDLIPRVSIKEIARRKLKLCRYCRDGLV